jgi:hypothetical protein
MNEEADRAASDYSTRPVKALRLSLILPYATFLITAISFAWYAWNSHKVLKQYRIFRDNFHMTDAEMADFGEHHQEYFDSMKRQDEFAAAVALGVLHKLDKGDLEGAKANLRTTLSIYYRAHQSDGDTNVIFHVEQYASTNTAVSNAIHRKLESEEGNEAGQKPEILP